MVNSVSLKIGFVVGRTNDSYGTKMDQTYFGFPKYVF